MLTKNRILQTELINTNPIDISGNVNVDSVTITDISLNSQSTDLNTNITNSVLDISGNVNITNTNLPISISDLSVNLINQNGSQLTYGSGPILSESTLRVAIAQPLSSPLDTNFEQLKGGSISSNIGNASNQTLRVVICSDQPTIDISLNNLSRNSGNADNGTLRTILADDQTEIPIINGSTILDVNQRVNDRTFFSTR